MTKLQKRALYSFIIGLAITISLVVILVAQGDITDFESNLNLRLMMYSVVVGVPLIYLILISTVRKPTQIDERDRCVIEKARKVQWFAVILSLAIWTIALTEEYRDQEQVPIAFLTLIFMSSLVISVLAQSLGILLGYWRIDRND